MKSKTITSILFLLLTIVTFGQERKSRIGTKAPNLTIEKFYSSVGATTNINELKGKLIILDFWGSWCGPCIKGFSHMNNLVMQFKDQPIQFITVGYEDTVKAKKILDKHNVLPWKAIDTDLSVFTDYAAWSIPLAIIINKEGVVVAEIHPEELTQDIIQLALNGEKIQSPEDVNLPYFDPDGAKEHFLSAIKN